MLIFLVMMIFGALWILTNFLEKLMPWFNPSGVAPAEHTDKAIKPPIVDKEAAAALELTKAESFLGATKTSFPRKKVSTPTPVPELVAASALPAGAEDDGDGGDQETETDPATDLALDEGDEVADFPGLGDEEEDNDPTAPTSPDDPDENPEIDESDIYGGNSGGKAGGIPASGAEQSRDDTDQDDTVDDESEGVPYRSFAQQVEPYTNGSSDDEDVLLVLDEGAINTYPLSELLDNDEDTPSYPLDMYFNRYSVVKEQTVEITKSIRRRQMNVARSQASNLVGAIKYYGMIGDRNIHEMMGKLIHPVIDHLNQAGTFDGQVKEDLAATFFSIQRSCLSGVADDAADPEDSAY